MMGNTEFPLERWQQVAEVTLPNITASERLLTETVALVGQRLHLREPLLNRLYTALSEAVHNRLQADPKQESRGIGLRVQVATQVTDRNAGDFAVWGFFLLEHALADDNGSDQPVLELYLYREPALRQHG